MTVLVTGGAGYIGSHTASLLLKQGRQVVVIDNLSTGKREFIPSGARTFIGNVLHREWLYRILKNNQIKTVMHFAASIQVEEGERNPRHYYMNNTVATATLMEEAARCGVKNIIFSSTAAVYGNPAVIPVTEDAPTEPTSVYGRSKLMAEQIIRDICRAEGMRSVALRYFNVLGVDAALQRGYQLESQPSHLVRRALAAALGRTESLPVYGTDYPTPDGTGVRDYLHVNDVAQAHLDALSYLEHGGASGTYNVGYGRGYSVLEVCKAVEEVTDHKLDLQYEPRRPGDIGAIIADSTRIRRELGWEPGFDDLKQMLHTQYRWELAEDVRDARRA